MKASIFTCLLIVVLCINASAQKFAELNINSVRARVYNTGDLFWDLSGSPKFEVPKATSGMPPKHTIFMGNLWIGGKDKSGNLHIAVQEYREQYKVDFDYGPISSRYLDNGYIAKYNNIWKLNAGDVKGGGTVVKAWPAHGDTTSDEAKNLAPFVDYDGDGNYDPSKGDYPDIRGDQAIWFVYNDDKVPHSQSGGAKLGVEIHTMAYGYNTNDIMDTSVFFNYNIINRSSEDYEDVYIGLIVDFEIGNGYDDLIGSIPGKNAFYAYNGDAFDDGINGYGSNPPVQGVVFLNQDISGVIYYNNDFSMNGAPENAGHYYGYLQSTWKNGAPLTEGGDGTSGTKPVKFAFPGDPVTKTGWSEEGEGNKPYDRKAIGSVGPFNLPAGSNVCLDVAYVFASRQQGDRLRNINLLRKNIDKVQTFYDKQNFICPATNTGLKDPVTEPFGVEIYPNPVAKNLNLDIDLPGNRKISVRMSDLSGKVVKEFSGETVDLKQIDVSGLKEGVYFMEISDGFNSIREKVLISR